MTSEIREAIVDGLGRILEEHCTSAAVREVEAGGEPEGMWQSVEASGFLDALVDEKDGGAGLGWADAVAVPQLCGRCPTPIPVTETMVVRGLLANMEHPIPVGPMTMAIGTVQPDGTLTCSNVPMGRIAEHVLVETPSSIQLLPVQSAKSLHNGFPLDASLVWPADVIKSSRTIASGHSIELIQAFIYAAQISGAMLTVLQQSIDYANVRKQFGRAIGKFQAIQHQLAVMAENVLASNMAVELAVPKTSVFFDPQKVAVAKARSSEAAVSVANAAHAIHGAIGFTEEYDLQLFTRRLNIWRTVAGSESYWYTQLGKALIRDDRDTSLDLLRDLTSTL